MITFNPYEFDCEYELVHHGVKGMKWGVRRSKYVLKRTIQQTSKTIAAENKRINVAFKKGKHKNGFDEKSAVTIKVAREREVIARAIRDAARTVLKDIDEEHIKIGREYVFQNGNMVLDKNSDYYETIRNRYYRYITGY